MSNGMVKVEDENREVLEAKARVRLARGRLEDELREVSQASKRVVASLRKASVPVLIGAGLIAGTLLIVAGRGLMTRRRRVKFIVRRGPTLGTGLGQMVVSALVRSVASNASKRLLIAANQSRE